MITNRTHPDYAEALGALGVHVNIHHPDGRRWNESVNIA
jgi:hypothetical protein